MIIIFLLLSISSQVIANQDKYMYKNFWNPKIRNLPLAACFLTKPGCGMAVADEYCKYLNYEKARSFKIAPNVGLTHFFDQTAKCQGWGCDSLSLIECEKKFPKTHELYKYKYIKFEYPRYEHHRIDWCFEKHKDCGKKVAYSFCRRMGYITTVGFSKEAPLANTRYLANGGLCYGENCAGFKSISCKR